MRNLLLASLLSAGAGGGDGAGPASDSGTLIVLNKGAASASLIDVATGAESVRVPTGIGPHEVAVSPDGRLAIVADYGEQTPGSTLTLIDVEKGTVVKKIDLAPYRRPHGIVWLGEEARVAVTSETSKALLLVDVDEGKVERVIETDQDASHMVAVTPDQKLAFTANIGSGSLTMIDLVEERALVSVKTGAGCEGIDVTPDGRFVWTANRAADTVSVFDIEKRAVVATLPCATFPIRVKVTPDGRHAVVSCAKSGDVAVFDTKERKETKRFKTTLAPVGGDGSTLGDPFAGSAVPIGVLLRPDGKRAWIAHANADAIAVIDCEKWEPIGTVTAGKGPDGLGFSPLRATKPAPSR